MKWRPNFCLGPCQVMGSLEEIHETYRDRIKTGQVSLDRLAFTSSLSKEPEQYVQDTYSSIAARQLAAAGVTLHAGETIQYVITSAQDKVKDWRATPLVLAINYGEYDPKKYLELLGRAYDAIAEGLVSKKKTPSAVRRTPVRSGRSYHQVFLPFVS